MVERKEKKGKNSIEREKRCASSGVEPWRLRKEKKKRKWGKTP
jgi:hypothetical protein